MDLSKLKEELIRDEGLKLKPYKCSAGKTTIGVGRNLDDVGISEVEADMLLINDINDAIHSLDMAFPIWKTLSDARQRALVNMMFNLGMSKFMKFRNMLSAIRAGDFKLAAEEALASAWEDQVGNRAIRIATMLENG